MHAYIRSRLFVTSLFSGGSGLDPEGRPLTEGGGPDNKLMTGMDVLVSPGNVSPPSVLSQDGSAVTGSGSLAINTPNATKQKIKQQVGGVPVLCMGDVMRCSHGLRQPGLTTPNNYIVCGPSIWLCQASPLTNLCHQWSLRYHQWT